MWSGGGAPVFYPDTMHVTLLGVAADAVKWLVPELLLQVECARAGTDPADGHPELSDGDVVAVRAEVKVRLAELQRRIKDVPPHTDARRRYHQTWRSQGGMPLGGKLTAGENRAAVALLPLCLLDGAVLPHAERRRVVVTTYVMLDAYIERVSAVLLSFSDYNALCHARVE